jgi:hypothetical protein
LSVVDEVADRTHHLWAGQVDMSLLAALVIAPVRFISSSKLRSTTRRMACGLSETLPV